MFDTSKRKHITKRKFKTEQAPVSQLKLQNT